MRGTTSSTDSVDVRSRRVLIDRAEAVSKIVGRIATIPYSRGAKVVSKHVEEVLDAEYFNIEPWPFAALVGDADRLEPGSPISS